MKKTLALFVLLAACGGKLPETRFYSFAQPAGPHVDPTGVVIAIQPLEVAPAYDDERIVYRTNPYRLDYYNYHRWSTTPGTLVADYLERAFEHSGKFRGVTRDSESAPVTLGGRIIAIEEVDQNKAHWVGRIVVELTLTATVSGDVLWTDQYEELEPLKVQTPEGLARALSDAMAHIAQKVLPIVTNLAVQTAQATASKGATPSRAARLKP